MVDKKKDDDELVRDLVQKVEDWFTYASEDYQRLRDHQTFLYVDQWDPDIRLARTNSKKPVLEANKLLPILRAILGEQRQRTPNIDVKDASLELKTPQQTIDLYNDYAREITYRDQVDIIIQNVYRQFFEGGWGAARVVVDYETNSGNGAFNKIVKIQSIVDIQTAFWDPAAQEWDKSDGDYCGVYQRMSRDMFKKQNPNIEMPESVSTFGISTELPWTTKEEIVIAEIYVKEHFNTKIAQLSSGDVMPLKDANDLIKKMDEALQANPDLALHGVQPLEIVNQRTIRDYTIKHYKFVQNALIEETEWPGKILPIPYGEGDSTIIDGKRVPLPFLTETIDTQKLYNYVISEISYAILRSRKETWMGTVAHFEGLEDIWRNPDNVQGALQYNNDPDSPGSTPVNIKPSAFPPELISLGTYVTQDLQQLTGRYEEARGEESNAQSGIAIAKRQSASAMPVNVYQDNLARFLRSLFLIVFDVMPNIMDTPNRKIMTRSADGKRQVTMVNKQQGFNFNQQSGQYQQNIVNDLTQSKVDVEVRVDGGYDDQKAQGVDFLLRLCAIIPQAAPLIADLVAENSGLENAQKVMNRFQQTLLPPQILAQEQGKPPPPPPPPPPPDPAVQVAQIKAQGDMQQQGLKQKELQLEYVKLQQQAQANGWDFVASMDKAKAEVIKSQSAVHAAQLKHATTVVDGSNKFIQNLQEAAQRHAEIQGDSDIIKKTGGI